MKRSKLKPIAILCLAAFSLLALLGCPPVTAIDELTGGAESISPRIEIYEYDELKAAYSLDDEGKVVAARSLGSYGDWSSRSYEYGSDGQVRSVSESFDINTVVNSRSYSTSRSLSRSGKVESIQYTVAESSNLTSRASTTCDYLVSYTYDEANKLVSIVMEDEFGNQEVKNVGRPCYSDEEIESGEIARALGGHNQPETTVRQEIDAGEGRSPKTASGGFEGCYIEYGADVLDYRPAGIPEAFSRGVDVSVPIDQLREGQVFIDEAGIARKLLRIEQKGSTLVYHTRRPDIEEVLTDLYLPATSIDFNDMDPMGELISDDVTVTQNGSAPARAVDGDWKLDTSGLGTSFGINQKVKLGDNGAANFKLELSPSVSLYLDYCFKNGTKRRPKQSWAKLEAELGIEVLIGFSVSGEWDKKIPIYIKGKETKFATMQFGLFFIPYFKGELSSNFKYEYVFGYKNRAEAMVGNLKPQSVSFPAPAEISNSMSYGFDLKAELEAGAKFLALGGEMTILGITLVESYPGAGVYASISAEMHMAEEKVNGVSTKKEAWLRGTGEIGAFIEASISFWNGKFYHTFINKKWPFASISASVGDGDPPLTNPRNPGVALPRAPGEVSAAHAVAKQDSITLSWIDPTDSNFGSVEIVCGDASVPTKTVTKNASTKSRVVEYKGLTANRTYTFTLKTVDTTGILKSEGVSKSATTYGAITHPSELPTDENGYRIIGWFKVNGRRTRKTLYVTNWWPVKILYSSGATADGYWWSEEADYLWSPSTAKDGLLQERTKAIVRDPDRERYVYPGVTRPSEQAAIFTTIDHPDFFTGKNYYDEANGTWRYRMLHPTTGEWFYPAWKVIEFYNQRTRKAGYYWYDEVTDQYFSPFSRLILPVPRENASYIFTLTTPDDAARWKKCMNQNPDFPESLTWSEV